MKLRINILEKKKRLLKEFAEFWYRLGYTKEYRFWFFDSKWEEWGITRLTKKSLNKAKERLEEMKKEWKELGLK